ncbi:MAG: dUTP diphosphatase [Patescibacteria group bacterium]
MTVQELIQQYQEIANTLNKTWPLDKQQRVFARTLKLTEEMGELADEILTSMKLQRNSKVSNFTQEKLEDEFADVFACVVLMGIELDIDVVKVMERKIASTRLRLEEEK